MSSASIRDLQLLIASWADQLHPERTPLSVICKLLEELAELIGSDKMSDPMELADIFILALDLAYLQGTDISRVVIEKMTINAKRKWTIQDNGRMTHVK